MHAAELIKEAWEEWVKWHPELEGTPKPTQRPRSQPDMQQGRRQELLLGKLAGLGPRQLVLRVLDGSRICVVHLCFGL